MKLFLTIALASGAMLASSTINCSAFTPPITPSASISASRSGIISPSMSATLSEENDIDYTELQHLSPMSCLEAPEGSQLDPKTLNSLNRFYRGGLLLSAQEPYVASCLLDQASVYFDIANQQVMIFPEAQYAKAVIAYNDGYRAAACSQAFQACFVNYFRPKTTPHAQKLDDKITAFCNLLIENGETQILFQLFTFHSAQKTFIDQLPILSLCAHAHKEDSKICADARQHMREKVFKMFSGLTPDDLILYPDEIQKHAIGLQYIIDSPNCSEEHKEQLRTILNAIQPAIACPAIVAEPSAQPVVVPAAVATTTTTAPELSIEDKIVQLKSELDDQAESAGCKFEQWLQKIDANQIVLGQKTQDTLHAYFSHKHPTTPTENKVWVKVAPPELKAQSAIIVLKSSSNLSKENILEALQNLNEYFAQCADTSKINVNLLFEMGVIYLLGNELPHFKANNIGADFEKASKIAQLLVQKGALEGHALGFIIHKGKGEADKAKKRFKQVVELLPKCTNQMKMFEYYRMIINHSNQEETAQLEPTIQKLLDANYLPAQIFSGIQLLYVYPVNNSVDDIQHGMTIILQALESSDQQLVEIDQKDMTLTLSDALQHALTNNKAHVPQILPLIKQLKTALNNHNARLAKQ